MYSPPQEITAFFHLSPTDFPNSVTWLRHSVALTNPSFRAAVAVHIALHCIFPRPEHRCIFLLVPVLLFNADLIDEFTEFHLYAVWCAPGYRLHPYLHRFRHYIDDAVT